MEYHQPVIFKRRNNEDSGSQHLLTEVIQKCFKCDRSKLECNGARNCRFNKKLDSSDVNLQEVVAKKFRVMKVEMKKRR